MNKEKIICPKCQNKDKQILMDIDLEGGHETNWQNRTEWDFARALLFMLCSSCGHEYELKIEWNENPS